MNTIVSHQERTSHHETHRSRPPPARGSRQRIGSVGAGGSDQVLIENNTNDGISTTILGFVNIDMGAGDDQFTLGLDANDKVSISKAVKFNGNLGLDKFDQSAATNTFTGTILGFEVQLP